MLASRTQLARQWDKAHMSFQVGLVAGAASTGRGELDPELYLCTELSLFIGFGITLSLGVAFHKAYLCSLCWARTATLFECSLLVMGLWIGCTSSNSCW